MTYARLMSILLTVNIWIWAILTLARRDASGALFWALVAANILIASLVTVRIWRAE